MISGTKHGWKAGALVLALILSGCKNSEEKANDAAVAQAKQQAATSGVAQQVVSTDANGDTVTTVVQPPAAGTTTQQITVTRTRTTTTTGAVPAQPQVQPYAATNTQPASPAGAGYGASAQALANGPADANYGPPPPAGAPVISPMEVEVPAGTNLAIRVNQRISVKSWHTGDPFSGEVVHAVMSGNSVAIPAGTRVHGVVSESHRRGHFKGRSYLGLRLTSMELNGQSYNLDTRDNVRTKKGKGKRTAAFAGGGAGAGMLIGGIASGGVGLVIGGLAGAGGGGLLGGLTGNRDLVIPAESVVSFKLEDDLAVQPQ